MFKRKDNRRADSYSKYFEKGLRDPKRDQLIVRPDGANIFYRYRDPDDVNSPTLVFQGGFTTHPAAWMGQIRSFRGDYGVVTMENRGHWHSSLGGSTPETYLDDMADDLKAIMDMHGILCAIIVGHSMWGGNAMRFYHKFPEMVSGLVLVAPAYMDPRKLGFLRDYPIVHPLTEFLAWSAGKIGPLDLIKRKVLGESELAWNVMKFVLLMTFMRDAENPDHAMKMIKNAYRADVRAMSMSMRALFMMDDFLYDKAPEIDVPTLLIVGDQDPLISSGSIAHLRERILGAELEVFEGSAHFPFLSSAKEFNETITAFIKHHLG